jgi:hypothetical protein
VKPVSDYAADQSRRIDLVKTIVPSVLAGVAVVLVIAGVILGVLARRRTSPGG